MLRAVVSVSSTHYSHSNCVIDDDSRLRSAEYTYPPLNATQYYLPPRANHSGDVTCDCNTVMYRYVVQIS